MKVNDADLRHFIALYDGGIRYTDEKIGKFLTYLRDSALYDQSLIIITSDHGEEFKEHGSLLHWQPYNRPNLHVPLIMHIPNYPKEQIRINELVQSVDLLPTILGITGLPAHTRAQGRSLLPLIKRKMYFLNRSLWRVVHLLKKDSNPSFAEELRYHKWSIINYGYQMIYDLKLRSIQLFNLKDDPYAKNNVAKTHDDIAKKLFSQHEEVYSKVSIYKTPAIAFDEQTREQLRALGYIDSQERASKCVDDSDCDGILNADDNCPNTPNPDQLDTFPPTRK